MFRVGHELGVVQINWAQRLKRPRNVEKLRLRTAKDFRHRTPFDQFIDELVQVARRTRELIVEVLNLVATNGAGDQVGIRVKSRLIEEGLERRFSGDVAVQVGLGIAREPLDHLEQLGLTPALLLDFGNVVRIETGEGERRDAGVVFGSCVCSHSG